MTLPEVIHQFEMAAKYITRRNGHAELIVVRQSGHGYLCQRYQLNDGIYWPTGAGALIGSVVEIAMQYGVDDWTDGRAFAFVPYEGL